MNISFKIGYFAHWFRPPYKFVDFLGEEGIEVEKIDFSIPMYANIKCCTKITRAFNAYSARQIGIGLFD